MWPIHQRKEFAWSQLNVPQFENDPKNSLVEYDGKMIVVKRRVHRAMWLLVMGLIAAAVPACSERASNEQSFQLPPRFRPNGVLVAGRRTLLWARYSDSAWWFSSDGRLNALRVRRGNRAILGVRFSNDSPVQWLDSTGATFDVDGKPIRSASARPASILRYESSVSLGDNWLVTSMNLDSSASLLRLSGDTRELFRFRSPQGPLHPYVDRSFITSWGKRFVLVNRSFPFRVLVLDSSMSIVDSLIIPLKVVNSSTSVPRQNAALIAIAAFGEPPIIHIPLADPFSLRRIELSSDELLRENLDGVTAVAEVHNFGIVAIEPGARARIRLIKRDAVSRTR